MAKKKTTKPKTPPRRSPRRSAGRVRSADLLRRIAVGVSAADGGNVLDSLIQYLTKTLSMDYAFVGEVVRDKGTDVINVLSATFAGRIADNPSCPILNTPCREVVKRNLCVYPQGVRKLFPKSRELADLEAECYAGVPLFGSAGQLLGVLAVMDRKPLRHRTMVELLLQIFAVRAAAELERRRVSQALEESHRTLSTLMGNLPGMVYRCRNDKDWTLEFASEGCLDLTGYPREDLTGNRQIAYAQLIRAEDQETVWSGVQEALRENRPFQLTYRITTAKGEEKWVWEQGRGIYSPSGELLALEGFITDITARKWAELALMHS
ncbi:MAG: PAS domain-containing protein, partial [Pseudomonadota bacterium]